jgi:hypothetical protein
VDLSLPHAIDLRPETINFAPLVVSARWAMPLLGYPYIEYDGRKSMRSLADALMKLREEHNLCEGQNVEIKTMGMRLPDGRSSGVVSVLGPQQPDGTRMVIFMPPSARFSARTTMGDRQTYMIPKLNDATSDSDGNVELVDGQFLHAIELIPAPAHYDFTPTEHKIVHAAIASMELERQCYRALEQDLLPGLKVLDYAKVAQVRIKKLKPVVRDVRKSVPEVSDTYIVATLKRAGMQLPRSRQ